MRAERFFITRQVALPAQAFMHTEVLSGILLIAAALIAVVWANSPWQESYFDLWETVIAVDLSVFAIEEDLRHWVNDGLMVLFFFVVGLEIKRELVYGELAGLRRAALPALAALGGMVAPALLYLSLNAGGDAMRGWGIPMATDIAFALGVLALVGKRIPSEVRVFLLAVAIIDDIGAITVIAIFYTESLSIEALGIAVLLVGLIAAMDRAGVREVNAYFLVGALVWVAVLKSGVHPTIAGAVLGVLTPSRPYFSKQSFAQSMSELIDKFGKAVTRGDDEAAEIVLGRMEELAQGTEAPLERLERLLHPLTSYAIVPLFALANAGLALSGHLVESAVSSFVTLGIVVGLLAGKPIGIVGFSWLAVRLGIGSLPANMRWAHMVGVGVLAGMGFTVSLFIAGLAFQDAGLTSDAKIGILISSIVAGALGYGLLRMAGAGKQERDN